MKLIEKGEKAGGIAAFLGKAVEPPAAAVIANAVASLQTIGALTCPPSPLFLGDFSARFSTQTIGPQPIIVHSGYEWWCAAPIFALVVWPKILFRRCTAIRAPSEVALRKDAVWDNLLRLKNGFRR